ncbi:pentatricopeptide repeat-containing protein At3g22150, chloroplastic [Impatiens glandulifera]|uniref:pentatricopeptide repeat-containing protein At3g22150, chloroplastic n=1 Tax=Impatiens glandulifera TaxID=253017 RepID=UPI001FB197CB|nr:pentatricopeptide repeat-containing protein At3g22150, chloroplastic [Impatiens glandulifera]
MLRPLSIFPSSSSLSLPPSTTSFSLSLPLNNSPSFPPISPLSEQCAPDDFPDSPTQPKTIRYRLSHLCKNGQLDVAYQLFDSIPRPTTVVWNTIIIGLVCNGKPDEAISLYSRMKSTSNTESDFYTYSAVLKACAETRRLKIGKAVHGHVLRSHFNPSRIVSNSLLNMYSTCLSSIDDDDDDDFVKYDVVCKVFDTMRKRDVIAWNTLISWYVKTNRFVYALEAFMKMMNVGIKPTYVTFVNAFPAVSRIGDCKSADVMYGLLVKSGKESVNDPFSVSSAIQMYVDLGHIEDARKVFDNMPDRNTEVWNTMISGYLRTNHPIQAIELFLDTSISDNVTFLLALTAASQLLRLDFAQQLHSCIIKKSLISSIIIVNALIVMYSRCNSIETSFHIFNQMRKRDVVSWNTIISGFVQNGYDEEGLILVYEMQKEGFLVDGVTVTALLSAASNLRNQTIGKQTHSYVVRNGIRFEGMESYLIDMYTKCGLNDSAKKIFSSSDKDQATWNSMVAGNAQNGLTEEAFAVFRQMLEEKIEPNAITLSSILPACHLGFGKQLHSFAIRRFLDQNVFVGSSLLDMYSKSGSIGYSENVFNMLIEKNSVTYTNMILAYGQHGNGEKALSVFNSMKRLGIQPDEITIVAILTACSYSGLVEEGIRIFESIERECEVKPSYEHYCCVVDMLGRVGRVEEAYDFILNLGEKGECVGIWGSLLAACRVHRRFKLGKIVANKLLEMGEGKTTGYRVLLSNIYAEEGNWKAVKKMRNEMREKGLEKDVGCSWIDVSGSVNCFVSKDMKHPQSDEIFDVLSDLSVKLKDGVEEMLYLN